MLQLINEMIAPGTKTSGELVKEVHREEDDLLPAVSKPTFRAIS
jgi:hypothetical protein